MREFLKKVGKFFLYTIVSLLGLVVLCCFYFFTYKYAVFPANRVARDWILHDPSLFQVVACIALAVVNLVLLLPFFAVLYVVYAFLSGEMGDSPSGGLGRSGLDRKKARSYVQNEWSSRMRGEGPWGK